MAAASLRSALLSSSSSSSSPAAALRRLSSAPRAPRFAQPKRFDRVRRFSPAAAMSTSSGTKEAPANNPGLQAEIDPATKGYFMQQTMFRVKDPKVSLDFYSRVMGMSLLKRLDFPDMKFSLYFLGYEDLSAAPADPVKRTEWTFGQKATIELTHNWGTETDPEFKGYHNGNSDPRGFGHIGVTVDDVYKACERFERLGVEFVKKPDDGYFVDWTCLNSSAVGAHVRFWTWDHLVQMKVSIHRIELGASQLLNHHLLLMYLLVVYLVQWHEIKFLEPL